MREPGNRRPRTSFGFALLVFVLITACGGPSGVTPPDGEGERTVRGTVVLPAGHDIDMASLSVTTELGSYPVSADGSFSAQVLGSSDTELGVENPAGDLLLLGVGAGGSAELSAESTAAALLFYLVGGMWLPRENQADARELLAQADEVADLAAELERMLAAGGNPVAEPDDQLLDALQKAHADLFGEHGLGPAAWSSGTSAWSGSTAPSSSGGTGSTAGNGSFANSLLQPAAVEGNNIIVEPTTQRAGAFVLHNPGGAGVVAQNHLRRPAALLAYETAWVEADGVEHAVDPPVLREEVDVPPTGQLEFLNALLDVVTGDAPWAPVDSDPLQLPGHEGASSTHFRLVLLGPSISDTQWPIWEDEDFTQFHDEWNDVIADKSMELFLEELLLPLIEVYGLGSMAKVDASKLATMRDRVRVIHDQHLAQLGVYLTQGQVGYANALRLVMTELVENRTYRLNMLEVVKDALEESDKNKAAIDAMEKRLAGRASASSIAAAVQAVLVGGDVARIMYDLAGTTSAADWTAVSSPALFALTPGSAYVSQHNSSARFTVVPKGETSGDFVYRWRTSGSHGSLTDLLQDEADTIETDSAEIWYFHDRPADIDDNDYDTIEVEVFEVEPGVTTVPAGAEPIARMRASVSGDDRLVDSRIEVNYGATPAAAHIHGTRWPCAEMYLRFAPEEGASTYTVNVRGVGGQGHRHNTNQDFKYRGPNHTVFIDPKARIIGPNREDGYTDDWDGVCTWMVDGHYASEPFTVYPVYDREEDEYLVHLFTVVEHGFGSDPLTVEGTVPYWYDWVKDATFEVIPNH